MLPRRSITHAVAVLAALAALAPAAATAQTTTGDGQPRAVEPVPGRAAPAPEPAPGEPLPGEPTAPATATPAQPTATQPARPQAARPVTPSTGRKHGVDWLALAAVALGAAVLALLVVLALWRWRGWDPRWARRWRHAVGEAGLRLSLGWAEFRDFVRLGR